jgi:hypothetical protein
MSQTQAVDRKDELTETLLGFKHDPLGFVDYAYDWRSDDLPDDDGPFEWQHQILTDIGKHLSNPATRYEPLRIAVASGKGIGKSALIAQILGWGVSTCKGCRCTVTANTKGQLDTKTVPEATLWFNRMINADWWDVMKTSIKSKDPRHEQNWKIDFMPWSIQNPQAFAGLHNKGKRIIVVMDEASTIPDVIWEVIDGVATDTGTEIIIIAFGNPTENTGRFRECFGSRKAQWKHYQIDSRKVPSTNKKELADLIEIYGDDSDWVRVNIKGEFPRAASSQFIAGDAVEACRKYKAAILSQMPKIMSIDVARFGDDESVIGIRQGRSFKICQRYSGQDLYVMTGHTEEWIEKEKPDGIVVDSDGLGAGLFDNIKGRGHGRYGNCTLVEFHGGHRAYNETKFFNRRAEVWGLMKDAIIAGMQIPDTPEFADDLTGVRYGFTAKQQIQLERKEEMKKRGLSSPDMGDCLAMSFAIQMAEKKTPNLDDFRRESLHPGHEYGWMA